METQATIRRTLGQGLVTLGVLMGLLGLAPHRAAPHDAAGGTATRENTLIDSATTFTTVLEVPFDLSAFAHAHHCVATASAQAVNPGGSSTENRYIFVLTLDNTSPSPNHPSARTIEFNDTPVLDDLTLLEVSSTFFFAAVPPGRHTIRWMARQASRDDENLTVDDASLSIICTQRRLE
jgi:hypothetical protein